MIVRLRIWHSPNRRSTSPFAAPGYWEVPLFDRSYRIAIPKGAPAIRQYHWLDLDGLPSAEGLHVFGITLSDGNEPRLLSVGVSPVGLPWDWGAGWFMAEGSQPRPAKLPHGLAWLLRGPSDHKRQAWAGRPLVRADGEPAVGDDPFTVVTPVLRIETSSGNLLIDAQGVAVPAPGIEDRTHVFSDGEVSARLPFRDVEIQGFPHSSGLHSRGRLLRRDNTSQPAIVHYRGRNARYDLLSLDLSTGSISLELGRERALDPEEFSARAPAGHLPLYSLYTTAQGVEPIFLGDWSGLVRVGDEARHLRWLDHCRRRLGKTLRKLRAARNLRLVGYGDSVTALGSRGPELLEAANGRHRDHHGYFECYGGDWKKRQTYSSADAAADGVLHNRLGWNWHLKQAIEERWPIQVEYLNWGIPGTTSDDSAVRIDGCDYPGASNQDRLERMLQDRPDLVTVAVGTNDVGEPIDTRSNVVSICNAIRAQGAEAIVIGPCRPNPDWRSRDPMLWEQTYESVLAGAAEADVAYIPTREIFGDGNEGALGLSARSYSAASMGNHPGARELAAVGAMLAAIFP